MLEFLDKCRASLFEKVRACGDRPEDLYPPKTVRDSRDKAASSLAVRIMGVESAGRQEVWLTVWSRGREELAALEELVRILDEWGQTGDPDAAESVFQKGGGSLILGFDHDEGSATMIYADPERITPFRNEQFAAHATTILEEMMDLLARTALGYGDI